jgi:hypothetical protein
MENSSLIHQHNMSLTELDSMIPWERAIYLDLLIKHLEKLKKEAEKN